MLVPVYLYRLRPQSDSAKLAIAPALIAASALPLWIPFELGPARLTLAIAALILAGKAVERGAGRVHDRAMWSSPWRFVLWCWIAPDTRWPASIEAARLARRRGLVRVARGAAKLAVTAALVLVPFIVALAREFWIGTFHFLWVLYLSASGALDVWHGLVMLSGIDVAESFDAPWLARSPHDFWSRRWNLTFRAWALRNVFQPLDGLRRPYRALLAVFALSGLCHEYLVLVSVGRPRGTMTAFFLLQGVATIGAIELRRRRARPLLPRPAGVLLHLAWLTLTSTLFFAQKLPIVPIHRMAASSAGP